MINKPTLVILISLIYSVSAFSQISEGGIPPSFKDKNTTRSVSTSQVPINLDISRLMWEDEMVGRKDAPLRVAEVIPVNINIDSVGTWTTFSDSVKIWQQVIVAEGAKGLILSYKDFYIPEGAKLYIYNEDRSSLLGAYTRNTHPQGGQFASEIVWGDKITLEYVASSLSKELPRIVIEGVGYIYNEKTILRASPVINNSESCMININCTEGNNWRNQQRGVVLYLVQIGSRWLGCSGSLVNNTRRDGTPYLLTANHCFVQDTGVANFTTMITYFNYEFSGCQNETVFPQTAKTLVGTDLLTSAPISETTADVTIKGSDGALLKLKENVPSEWKPFYNGWDTRNVAASSGVVIHHPNLDVKKIIVYDKSLITTTYIDSKYTAATNAHWKVEYNGKSVSQMGSSGSPIFNENGLIVGTLTGGESSCSKLSGNDYFGKFAYHWDYLKDENKQMKKYLDPINENVTTLKGYDPNNPLGIDEASVEDRLRELVVFPTPADYEVNINADSIIRTIKIYDMSGRQMYAKTGYNASTITIPVSSWPKGVYSVLVYTESKKISGKFIKK